MALDIFSVNVTGRLGRDPELKYVGDGTPLAKLRVAVSGPKETTSWMDVVVWGKSAEPVAEALHKGSRVAVVGRGCVREYEKRDGSKGLAFEVEADRFGGVVYLDPPKAKAVANSYRQDYGPTDDGGGDVPF